MSNKITEDELELMKKLEVYSRMPLKLDSNQVLKEKIEKLKKSTKVSDEKIIKKVIDEIDERKKELGIKELNLYNYKKLIKDYPLELRNKIENRIKGINEENSNQEDDDESE